MALNVGSPAAGSLLQGDAVVTSAYATPLAPENYVATVTIARDGEVVSTWAEGQDAGPAISIAAGGNLVVPVTHDLIDTCTTGDAGATGGSGTTGGSNERPAPDTSTPATPESGAADSSGDAARTTPSPAATTGPRFLPPGEYTAVVAVHVVRDDAAINPVVASSGIVPLTITP